MTDGQAAETPPGTPSRRALGAMESAVRRAREAQGGLPPLPPREEPPAPAPMAAPIPPRQPPAGDPADQGQAPVPARRRPDRWLVVAVVAASVLVVVAAAALAVSASRHAPPGAHAPSKAAPAPAHAPPRSGTAAATTTSTTTPPVGPAGAPVIGSLTPSSGDAGSAHRGRGRQLPQLERPDRGHVQRPGGTDELSRVEHLHGHGPAPVGLVHGAGVDHHLRWHLQRRDLHLRLAGTDGEPAPTVSRHAGQPSFGHRDSGSRPIVSGTNQNRAAAAAVGMNTR